ncbi:MAG: restriction endonuclease subunit S [Sulfuritalea sp.]|nr:restriction endonuclease subunit S [Sulfuritalea sp.]
MPDVLALFPDSFQESALGEIPAGWTWSTIGDEAEIVGGGTPSTKVVEYWNGGTIYWTTPKDLSGNPDRVLTTTERKITEAGLKSITSGLLPIGTVLMSSRAPVGYLAMAKVPTAINQGFIAMKCEKQLSSEYVLQWAHSVMDQIKQRSSGTTFAEISKKNFRSMSILVPPVDLVNQYTAVTSRLYDKITTCVEESRSLIDLRDMLLPKLMSGDISVGELQDD